MIASGFRLDDQSSGTGVRRFALTGELDAHTAREFLDGVAAGLDGHVEAVHLDMGRLEFIDSAGLRALVRLEQQLRDAGRQLVLESPTDAVRQVLGIADLEGYFQVV